MSETKTEKKRTETVDLTQETKGPSAGIGTRQSEQQQRLSEQEINRGTGAQLAAGFEHTKEKK
jgi:hypothetical protein